ncbi:hypothetical protein JCM10213v2_004288 [Rhodosporidiobolus nylandii]
MAPQAPTISYDEFLADLDKVWQACPAEEPAFKHEINGWIESVKGALPPHSWVNLSSPDRTGETPQMALQDKVQELAKGVREKKIVSASQLDDFYTWQPAGHHWEHLGLRAARYYGFRRAGGF